MHMHFSIMPINSRKKGERIERGWRDQCNAEGFPSFRGAQHSGKNMITGEAASDVQTPDLKVHWEVKGRKRIALVYEAMAQAEHDANDDEMPMVVLKADGKPWLVVLKSEDAFKLIRESEFLINKNETKTESKGDGN